MNPEPMAWCLIGEEPMRILDAAEVKSSTTLDQMESLKAGQLHFAVGKLSVKCAEGTVLELLEVQPSSKRAMSAKDWYNGNSTIELLS
jgi:methionyl-tRNA formyltransferase